MAREVTTGPRPLTPTNYATAVKVALVFTLVVQAEGAQRVRDNQTYRSDGFRGRASAGSFRGGGFRGAGFGQR